MLVVEPLLTYRFGRVQEDDEKGRLQASASRRLRPACCFAGLCARVLSAGTVFGHVLSRPVLPMASMPAGGFIVLGVVCAVWRTLAGKYKNYLTSEARGLMRSTARRGGA